MNRHSAISLLLRRSAIYSPKTFKLSTSSTTDDVICQDFGDKGVITLNRPKVLNAINFSVASKLISQLLKWEKEKTLVIQKGAGEKVFSSGGDLREIFARDPKKNVPRFFQKAYTADYIFATYKVPRICLIDGVIMGGAVGMALLGPYRVVTERTVLSLPETQIGYFPDASASYYLPRLKGKLGWFLGLTGFELKGHDIFQAGIATHIVESKNLDALENDLLKCSNIKCIDGILKRYTHEEDTTICSLGLLTEKINHYFSCNSVEKIIEKLKLDGSEFAKEIHQMLENVSPISLKITMEALKRGANMTLQECLQMEYRILKRCVKNHDFQEGARALFSKKNTKPKWNPSTLSEVTSSEVESYFAKLPETEELKFELRNCNK